MRETITENKMGVAPVWSLLLKMALPVILSTAVQALYNIVDGIFVAMISEKALSAITYAMPMVTLLTALSTGIAVGMNTMLSRALGEKIQQEVNDAAEAAVFLVMITGAVSLDYRLYTTPQCLHEHADSRSGNIRCRYQVSEGLLHFRDWYDSTAVF